MNHTLQPKALIGFSSILCVALLVSPLSAAGPSVTQVHKTMTSMEPTQSKHYALLFAVGEYLNAPGEDRPEMLDACNDLYNTLLDSPAYWQEANIHVVTSNHGTLNILLYQLNWLKQVSTSEDYVLVYLTTHGGHLHNLNGAPLDLPPKDEADGSDELLVMYNGFAQWYGFIWDDLLNFMLSRIQCKGLCLIVDSCYSGGFNDPPYQGIQGRKDTGNASSFTQGLMEDVAGQGRVTLMSSGEDQVSYGAFFSEYLAKG
ncbi:MAG TPA: hypothetical protein VMT57_05995, partial [Candidatus Thermoplasmatota archaeon]|nr:hypothetical protein [Candidatus Thermoplasmatota archaeon]